MMVGFSIAEAGLQVIHPINCVIEKRCRGQQSGAKISFRHANRVDCQFAAMDLNHASWATARLIYSNTGGELFASLRFIFSSAFARAPEFWAKAFKALEIFWHYHS